MEPENGSFIYSRKFLRSLFIIIYQSKIYTPYKFSLSLSFTWIGTTALWQEDNQIPNILISVFLYIFIFKTRWFLKNLRNVFLDIILSVLNNLVWNIIGWTEPTLSSMNKIVRSYFFILKYTTCNSSSWSPLFQFLITSINIHTHIYLFEWFISLYL